MTYDCSKGACLSFLILPRKSSDGRIMEQRRARARRQVRSVSRLRPINHLWCPHPRLDMQKSEVNFDIGRSFRCVHHVRHTAYDALDEMDKKVHRKGASRRVAQPHLDWGKALAINVDLPHLHPPPRPRGRARPTRGWASATSLIRSACRPAAGQRDGPYSSSSFAARPCDLQGGWELKEGNVE